MYYLRRLNVHWDSCNELRLSLSIDGMTFDLMGVTEIVRIRDEIFYIKLDVIHHYGHG